MKEMYDCYNEFGIHVCVRGITWTVITEWKFLLIFCNLSNFVFHEQHILFHFRIFMLAQKYFLFRKIPVSSQLLATLKLCF